jgi:hypothetical protein
VRNLTQPILDEKNDKLEELRAVWTTYLLLLKDEQSAAAAVLGDPFGVDPSHLAASASAATERRNVSVLSSRLFLLVHCFAFVDRRTRVAAGRGRRCRSGHC